MFYYRGNGRAVSDFKKQQKWRIAETITRPSGTGTVDLLTNLRDSCFQYKCDNFYAPQADGGISIKDDSLGIDWRIPTENALLSEKDMKHELLKEYLRFMVKGS